MLPDTVLEAVLEAVLEMEGLGGPDIDFVDDRLPARHKIQPRHSY